MDDLAKNGSRVDSRFVLSVEEAASALGVSRSLLYREVSAGRVPSLKISGRRLLPVESLRRWVEAEVQRQGAERAGGQ